MNNSRNSITSSSKHIFEENHEKLMPMVGTFSHQHLLTSPIPALLSLERSRYRITSDGYLVSNRVPINDMSKPFKEKLVILEIPCGLDIINGVIQFAQRYQLSVTVLNGHGLISEVDFMMYPSAAIPPVYISGCYQMVSFSGTYRSLTATSGEIISCFNVSFLDAEGNVMGGLIASIMKAGSNVTLVVTISKDF